MMNGKLNAGEVNITLSGESFTLRPTMRAHNVLSRPPYSGLAKVRQMLMDENIDGFVAVIAAGINPSMSAKDTEKLRERIWDNGVNWDLARPLMKYIAILNNGGRDLPPEIDAIFDDDMTTVNEVPSHQQHGRIEDYSEGNG